MPIKYNVQVSSGMASAHLLYYFEYNTLLISLYALWGFSCCLKTVHANMVMCNSGNQICPLPQGLLFFIFILKSVVTHLFSKVFLQRLNFVCV